MFQRISKKSSNRLQKRLIGLTLGITLGVGILFSTVFTSLYQNYLLESLTVSTATNMKFLADSIDANLESVNHLIRWAQVNTTIGTYIDADNDHSYGIIALKAHERLNEEYQNNPVNNMIHRIVIGNIQGRFIQIIPAAYSSTHNLGWEIPKQPYFDSLFESSNHQLSTGFMEDPFYSSLGKQVIPLIRPIYAQYQAKEAGWIFMQVTSDLFTNPVQYYSYADDANLYLVLGEHTYQLSEHALVESDFTYHIQKDWTATISKKQRAMEGCHIYSIHEPATNQNSIIIRRQLSQNGCYLVQTLSDNEWQTQNKMLTYIWIVILVMMLFVGLSLSWLLQRLIAIPVQKIRQQISSVSRGCFTPDATIEWDHELGDIGRGINKLAGDMEHLIENRIRDEKERKDLEYKVLQNQINPHFLYNTLNSIKWMATIQGADGIADMTTSLSRLLRSISKGTKLLIPLSEELSLVQDYFNIQNYRYGGTIQFSVDCDDVRFLQVPIIKFTLQPIVENAIFHGLEPKGNIGSIKIKIQLQPDSAQKNLEIIVWDNGVGISAEKQKEILSNHESAPSEFFKEIGISNVQQRLQYEFGSEYGIRIDSVVNEYTKMHIIIPASGLESK